MPHVDEMTLIVIDAALQVAGVLVFTGAAVRMIRRGEWRDPIDTRDFNRRGPDLFQLLAVFVFYILLTSALQQLQDRSARIGAELGSHAWHVAQILNCSAQLVTVGLMMYLLHGAAIFPKRAGNPGLGTIILLAMGTTLVVFVISGVQVQAVQTVWFWIAPRETPPVHDVLQAIDHSAWGRWGVIQLVIAAIVIAPLAEEFFFRGMILGVLWTYIGKAWPAVILSGVAFGLIHLKQPQAVLPLASMGIILGYVRMRYRSLSLCVLVHALFNARTILIVLCNPEFSRCAW